jgi:hypothetical protein
MLAVDCNAGIRHVAVKRTLAGKLRPTRLPKPGVTRCVSSVAVGSAGKTAPISHFCASTS